MKNPRTQNLSKVSIIILNWNGWEDTIECLESLYQITYPNYNVIVVDNGSEDDSIGKIKEYLEGKIKVESKFFEYDPSNKPINISGYTREVAEAGGGKEREIGVLPSNKKLILIKNEKNYGFAEGNNIGIRYALKALNPDYVLLLNNDTVINREYLTEMITVARTNKKIGLIGPKALYYENSDLIHNMGGYINYIMGVPIGYGAKLKDEEYTKNNKIMFRLRLAEVLYRVNYGLSKCIGNKSNELYKELFNKENNIKFLSGASLLIPKEVIMKIGLLDPVYFAGHEDTDISVRIQMVGYKLACAPKAKLYHKISATTKRITGLSVYYKYRNRLIFMKRYATKLQILLFFIVIYLFNLPFTLTLALIKKRHNLKEYIILFKSALRGVHDGFIISKKEKKVNTKHDLQNIQMKTYNISPPC